MKITINGNEVEVAEGTNLLEVSLDAGIYIPHLCKHPDLEAVGGCRLCMVEVEGQDAPVCACKTEVREGMVVNTAGEAAERVRKLAMELILATHPTDCTGCPKYGKCELQSMYQYMGVSPTRWRVKSRPVPTDEKNPLITHMFTRCIRCGRCVRACRELRGAGVLDYQHAEEGIRIGTDGGVSLQQAGCRFCGACIEVCPTGSIVDTLNMFDEAKSYADNVVPCRAGCPAHVDIPRYLRLVKEKRYTEAAAVVREKVPFPESLGNICVHSCQSACKRNDLNGTPLSVCRLKRAAAVRDEGTWKANVRHEPLTGKKVAVVGAGPAGLTAALYCAEKGHRVDVYEANEKVGGQMRYGIPAYRLPDEVVDREVATILEVAQGSDDYPRIKLMVNQRVKDPKGLLDKGYDAVLVTVGTHDGTVLPIPGHDFKGVSRYTDFLKAARKGEAKRLDGQRIVVLGGGNVAYDVARTAVRLGAAEVHVACLEGLIKMPCTPEERMEGDEEGIILHDAYSFVSVGEDGDHNVACMNLHKVARFYFDENHKAVTELVKGGQLSIPCDQVIFAVGQKPEGTLDMGLECTHGPFVVADAECRTSAEGVWAAGDCVTGTKSVIAAIEQGRNAAVSIDRYLGGDGDISAVLTEPEEPCQRIGRVPDGFYGEAVLPHIGTVEERSDNFEPFECPFTEEEATCEASRCLQCDLRLTLSTPRLWNEY